MEYTLALSYATIRLRLSGNRSLKGKRQVLRKIVDRVRNKFNVSISEIAEHDNWQLAVLGIAAVSNERGHADSMLNNVVRFIEQLYVAEIIDFSIRSL